MEPSTKSQAEVHVILENMRMKVLVTKSVIVGFFIVLVFLILLISNCIKSDWQTKVAIAALDALLAGTMYPLVTHYLPAKNKANAAEKKAKDNTSS